MITYATYKAPLRVSAPTVIPVCDHWNRGKTEVLSAQDGRPRIQGQTNIRPLPRLITNNKQIKKKELNITSVANTTVVASMRRQVHNSTLATT